MCTANMNSSTDTVKYVFSSCTRNVINEMATYECGVILFMISLYWGSKLHPANGILDDSQRHYIQQMESWMTVRSGKWNPG